MHEVVRVSSGFIFNGEQVTNSYLHLRQLADSTPSPAVLIPERFLVSLVTPSNQLSIKAVWDCTEKQKKDITSVTGSFISRWLRFQKSGSPRGINE